uniref:Saposin B-type domain-containing protein n=1 Tax=Strongyloides venezuelensis TaxID=75913 RepID=A0A0K0FRT6_STRVS
MSYLSNCTARKGISDPFGMCGDCITKILATPTATITPLPLSTMLNGSSSNTMGGISELIIFMLEIALPYLLTWLEKTAADRSIINMASQRIPFMPPVLQ